ncbi:MAG: transferase [Deltaproteobacteria bacterium]|nr:transferase [Deltaproteobacteria bacterium]
MSRAILKKDMVFSQSCAKLDASAESFFCVLNKMQIENAACRNRHLRDDNGKGVVNPLHSDQYAKLMYMFARKLFLEDGDRRLPDQIFFSIRSRAALDLYYEVEIPDFFYPLHSMSTVLGRAKYGRFFVVRQGCTVGNNHGEYPKFGEGVVMRAHSKVVGNSKIGDNVQLAIGALVIDQEIPPNSIVFGTPKNQVIKPNPMRNIDFFFPHIGGQTDTAHE